MLHFGAKPPFSYERFLDLCRGLIPDEEIETLKSLPQAAASGSKVEGRPSTYEAWVAFETCLRNELVKVRASRKKVDAAKYLRPDGYADPSVAHLALTAYRSASPLEGEKICDEERWRYLDALAFGHYFDLDALIIYALKLVILERWERIRREDKHKLLEGVLWQQREKGVSSK
jgi:hypothetical protein